MNRKNIANSNKRTIIIVVLAVLIVLCLLILPWFCSSGSTNIVPPQPAPKDPEYIPVRQNTKPGTGDLSNRDTSAVIKKPTDKEKSDHTDSRTTITNQKPQDTTYVEPTTPTPSNPDLTNTTSPTEPDLQDISKSTDPDEQGATETIVQEELELTSENTQSSIPDNLGEEQTDKDDQAALRKPSVVPRNIPVDPTSNPGAVSHGNQPLSPIPQNNNINSGETGLILWVVILVILLICYIIARVRSKRGDLVITANIFDKILIIVSPILFFIAWCIGFDHELTPLQIILLVLSGVMLIGSILFSIFANLGNIFNIIISILAKIFIFIFTNFLLLLLVVIVVFSFMRAMTSHNDTEGTYVMKYDQFLDQWVGYRID